MKMNATRSTNAVLAMDALLIGLRGQVYLNEFLHLYAKAVIEDHTSGEVLRKAAIDYLKANK